MPSLKSAAPVKAFSRVSGGLQGRSLPGSRRVDDQPVPGNYKSAVVVGIRLRKAKDSVPMNGLPSLQPAVTVATTERDGALAGTLGLGDQS
jgi:hypothetical protein